MIGRARHSVRAVVESGRGQRYRPVSTSEEEIWRGELLRAAGSRRILQKATKETKQRDGPITDHRPRELLVSPPFVFAIFVSFC